MSEKKPPPGLYDQHLGMEAIHTLGTEPANRLPYQDPPLDEAARAYSDELQNLTDAIEGEQAAVFAGQVPTYRFTVARLRVADAMHTYRQARVDDQVRQLHDREHGSQPEESP